MSQTTIPDRLRVAITERYGLSLYQERQIDGGDECLIWHALSQKGEIIVRISPSWRSPERLIWTHYLMLALQTILPQVVAPLKALDGSTLFPYKDQSVALFPYITGVQLDRENPALRHEAATLLARLHTALLNTATPQSLERNLALSAPRLLPAPDPDALRDPELDAWHAALLQDPTSFTCGLIHGDYYRRNLLTRDEQIIGLLDWDNLHVDFLMQEVAWSTWGICKNATGVNWHPERVQAFVNSYHQAGGPCKSDEYHAFLPFIRWRMREELRSHFRAIATGLAGEPRYAARQLLAFEQLRNYPLDLVALQ